MNSWTCIRQGELYHHGIKGQKWGVRRFQNKDGSLTPAGKRRYDEPNTGRNNKQYVDKVAKKAKTYKIPKNKSLHRLQLEEKYMKNGMTLEQAEQAAAKRIRTEKFVTAAAAVTVASAVAYAKYKGYTKEQIFKEGSEFQRIMRLSENAEIKDGRQYLAFDKKDKIKYKGMLGETFEKAATRDHRVAKYVDPDAIKDKVYDVTVKNKKEIRVASEKVARDTFSKLYKEDMQFRTGLRKAMRDQGYLFSGANPSLQRMIRKAENHKEFSDLDLKTKAYDLFNIMLMDKTEQGTKNANKFYDALRKQGVNALIDVNDRKYSGYKSKMPIITLDDGFEYTKRVMESDEIAKNNHKALAAVMVPEILKTGSIYAAYFASKPVMKKAQIEKRVLTYKAEHPNTKMTDAEIEEMIAKQIEEENNSKK